MATFCFIVIIVIAIVIIASRVGKSSNSTEVSLEDISPPRTPAKPPQWIPNGESVNVAGVDIGGMVYIGQRPDSGDSDANRSVIYLKQTVARQARDYAGEGMPYWPRYATIDPESRATYLEWLSSGRAGPQYSVGYVFLYFYGLEYRFFVEQANQEERVQIVAEVRRLLEVYGSNDSVRRYLQEFLDHASLLNQPILVEPVLDVTRYRLPVNVQVALGSMVAEGKPLTCDWLLSWYLCQPDTRLRTAPKRAFEEFKVYFGHLFDQKYPKGYKVRAPKSRMSLKYRAAAATFTSVAEGSVDDIPDVGHLKAPLRVAERLVEAATDGLDKYSRFLGRYPERRGSIQAHALLPEPIWSLFHCTEVQQLRSWAEDIIKAGGFVPVGDLIQRIDGKRPEKILKSQLTITARALAVVGLGMSPDPQFALQKPQLKDPVYLFRLPEGVSPIESTSDAYQHLTLKTAVAAFVAAADGRIDHAERVHISSEITQHEGLSKAEHIRLQAYLTWLLEVPPSFALLRNRLRGASEDLLEVLSKMAIVIAGADGVIARDEVRIIERLYGAMGLDKARVFTDLNAISASSGPVVVRRADQAASITGMSAIKTDPPRPVVVRHADQAASGYKIPPPPKKPNGTIVLDPDRIKKVMEDTARASQVLHSVFADEDEVTEPESVELEPENDEMLQGLDQQHIALMTELMTRPAWTESELTKLAQQYQLMAEGALDTINDWAYEHFDDAIIEEHEGFELNGEILKQIRDS